MGCCGQRRDILRRPPAPTPPERIVRAPVLVRAEPWAAPARTAPVPPKMVGAASFPSVPHSLGVALEYTERARILVRGLATGRTYEFSAARRAQTVDAADVPPLLRTGFFRRT